MGVMEDLDDTADGAFADLISAFASAFAQSSCAPDRMQRNEISSALPDSSGEIAAPVCGLAGRTWLLSDLRLFRSDDAAV